MSVDTIQVSDVVIPKRGLVTLLGGCLLLISFSVDFSYANLNTYVISYLRSKNSAITYADFAFVSQTKTIVQGVFMPFGGELSRRIGVKNSIILGSTVYSGSYLLLPLVMDHLGLVGVVVAMGASHGLGFSLTYAQALGAVMEWFPANQGFMTSFTLAGYGFGAVIWNPLETKFVNPENTNPVVVPGEQDRYFVDETVLANIPKLFYLLGGVFVAMQLLAILLIREPSKQELKELEPMVAAVTRHKNPVDQEPYSVRPLDVLRTKEFYLLWIAFFAISLLGGFVNNYQKTFGQIYIHDDSFFALIATFASILNGCGRIFWGRVFDSKGYRFTVIVIASISTAVAFSFVNLSLLPEDSFAARLFYALWICVLYSTYPGIYACMAPVLMQIYGPKHYSSNFGLAFTQSLAYSALLLVATQTLFIAFGYYGMFFLTGGFGLIGMISTFLFPANIKSENYKERFGRTSVTTSQESANTQ